MKPLSPTARFAAKPGLVTTDLESELILLDPDTQQMYSLNPTGRLVWKGLSTDPLDALVTSVVEAFAIDRATATRDVTALLNDLVGTGLIETLDGE